MRLDHLVAHGFSDRTIANWKRFRDAELLPLQAHAVAHTGLLRGESLAVFAPTSSGKTFLGELAALHHIERGGRAVFLVPTKALAEELATYLHSAYGPLSLRVCLSTAEQRQDDEVLARGQFHLAVAVYEKLRALLAASPELAGLISCVVADELQILGDRERGRTADLLLTKFLAQARSPQVVAMSAVLDDHERLASWLGAQALVWNDRPVELREGILDLSTGIFRYREWNSRREATEQLLDVAEPATGLTLPRTKNCSVFDAPIAEGLTRLAQELVAQRGEQLLVFVPTKALSREVAGQLARALPRSSWEPEATEELALLTDESAQHAFLAKLLAHSVAFHNADLPALVRRAIEQGFDQGRLSVLVATSTLAQGVNLGCRNVVSLPIMVIHGEVARHPVAVPLSRSRLRNQGGRAGRYRRTMQFGRSIVVARDESEAHRLFDLLLRRPVEPLAVSMGSDGAAMAVLDAIVMHHGGGLGEAKMSPDDKHVEAFLARTYAWRVMNNAAVATLTRSAVQVLEAYELIEQQAWRYIPTGTGEVAATFGLEPGTAAHLRRYVETFAERAPAEAFPYLLAAASSPQGAAFPLSASPWEIRTGKYLHLYHDYWREHGGDPVSLPFQLHGGGANSADHAALKKAFLAQAWISVRATRTIEEAFSILSGTIESLAHHLAWLVEAMGAIAGRLGLGGGLQENAAAVAERLRFGVPECAVALARAFAGTVPRSALIALAQAGFDSPAALDGVSDDVLRRVVPAQLVPILRETRRRGDKANHSPESAEVGAERCGGRDGLAQPGSNRADVFCGGVASTSATFAVSPVVALRENATAPSRILAQHQVDVIADRTQLAEMGSDSTAQAPRRARVELDPRSPGVVRVNEVQVFLSVMPYRLLTYLARHEGRVVPYEELDAELWPDAKVEQQQILAHKATIVRRLAAVLGGEEARRILRTVPGHGLYLEPSVVQARSAQ
ncbi:MAG: DEAD/DEAH box helicase [Candidatus Sumerlaeaceae bacterium]